MTNIQYAFVPDLAIDNDVLVLPKAKNIAAGTWLTTRQGRLDAARTACLRYVVDLLSERDLTYEKWLVVGHRAPQPRSPLVRHMGIRGYLERQSIRFERPYLVEQAHDYEDGLRYQGAVCWDIAETEMVDLAMRRERGAVIFVKASRSKDVMSSIVAEKWDAKERVPSSALRVSAREPILVIDAFGEFDDREVLVAAMGQLDVLRALGIAEIREQSR